MSFSLTSRNIRLEGASILVADCLTASGEYVESRLVLDDWLGVKDGYGGDFDAFPQEPGFSQQVHELRLDHTKLSAALPNRYGSYTHSKIDMDKYIGNRDGRLVSLAP